MGRASAPTEAEAEILLRAWAESPFVLDAYETRDAWTSLGVLLERRCCESSEESASPNSEDECVADGGEVVTSVPVESLRALACRREEAADSYARALAFDKRDAGTTARLAATLAKLGRKHESRVLAERAKRLGHALAGAHMPV
jgi:hypothetical protein